MKRLVQSCLIEGLRFTWHVLNKLIGNGLDKNNKNSTYSIVTNVVLIRILSISNPAFLMVTLVVDFWLIFLRGTEAKSSTIFTEMQCL